MFLVRTPLTTYVESEIDVSKSNLIMQLINENKAMERYRMENELVSIVMVNYNQEKFFLI